MGGAGPSATVFLRRLAALSSEKNHTNYSTVIELLRVHLSFACDPRSCVFAVADRPHAIQNDLNWGLWVSR